MDFVLGNRPTQRKNDLIMVLVDQFPRWLYLISHLEKTVDTSSIVIFFKEGYKFHGLSTSIFPNKYAKFLAHF